METLEIIMNLIMAFTWAILAYLSGKKMITGAQKTPIKAFGNVLFTALCLVMTVFTLIGFKQSHSTPYGSTTEVSCAVFLIYFIIAGGEALFRTRNTERFEQNYKFILIILIIYTVVMILA